MGPRSSGEHRFASYLPLGPPSGRAERKVRKMKKSKKGKPTKLQVRREELFASYCNFRHGRRKRSFRSIEQLVAEDLATDWSTVNNVRTCRRNFGSIFVNRLVALARQDVGKQAGNLDWECLKHPKKEKRRSGRFRTDEAQPAKSRMIELLVVSIEGVRKGAIVKTIREGKRVQLRISGIRSTYLATRHRLGTDLTLNVKLGKA